MLFNTAQNSPQSKPLPHRLTLWVGIATVAVGSVTAYSVWGENLLQPKAQEVPEVIVPETTTVTALGHLEPAGEVIQLSVPASSESSRITELLVQEGDEVIQGQVIAILDNRDRLQASLEQAKAQVSIKQSRLEQTKSGAKIGEIQAQRARFSRTKAELSGQIDTQRATIANLEAQLAGEKQAQEATIERLEAELRNAETDYQRYQTLYVKGAVSAQQRDSNYLQAETSRKKLQEAQANLNRIVSSRQAQITEAKANLNRTIATVENQITEEQATLDAVAEVRPIDVQIAENELEAALADLKKAQADLETAYVRSLQDGQILKIYTRPGEQVSSDGIVEIGKTEQMYAVAEVYESDISKVKVGQQVKVTSNSFPDNTLQGTVEKIGFKIERQDVINEDPTSNINAKVVEVKVALDEASSQKVAGLTNLQVTVEIGLLKEGKSQKLEV